MSEARASMLQARMLDRVLPNRRRDRGFLGRAGKDGEGAFPENPSGLREARLPRLSGP